MLKPFSSCPNLQLSLEKLMRTCEPLHCIWNEDVQSLPVPSTVSLTTTVLLFEKMKQYAIVMLLLTFNIIQMCYYLQ